MRAVSVVYLKGGKMSGGRRGTRRVIACSVFVTEASALDDVV